MLRCGFEHRKSAQKPLFKLLAAIMKSKSNAKQKRVSTNLNCQCIRSLADHNLHNTWDVPQCLQYAYSWGDVVKFHEWPLVVAAKSLPLDIGNHCLPWFCLGHENVKIFWLCGLFMENKRLERTARMQASPINRQQLYTVQKIVFYFYTTHSDDCGDHKKNRSVWKSEMQRGNSSA